MVTVETVRNYLRDFEVPVAKTPIITWTKIPNKAERESMNLTDTARLDMYFNTANGKVGYTIREVIGERSYNDFILFEKTSKDEIRYYIKYLPILDAVIFGMASLNLRAVKKSDVGVPRKWKREGEILITRDKRVFYRQYRWCYNAYGTSWERVPSTPFEEHATLSGSMPFSCSSISARDSIGVNGEKYAEMAKELLTMFPRFANIGANKKTDLLSAPYCFESFLRYKEPKIKLTPRQKKINELVSIPLPPIPYKDEYDTNMAFIDKVKDGMCVLRTMTKDEDRKEMIDGARVYVTAKESIACRPDNNGNWVNMVMRSNCYNWSYTLNSFDPDIVKGTTLEYFGSVVNDIPKKIQGKVIQAMLSYPVIEQLAKAGLKPYVMSQFEHLSWSKAIDPFEEVFGKIDTTKKGLMEQLGINKHQFKHLAEALNSQIGEMDDFPYYMQVKTYSPLTHIKNIMEGEVNNYGYYHRERTPYINIAHLDDKTFDTLFDSLMRVKKTLIDDHDRKRCGSYMHFDRIRAFARALYLTKSVYSTQVMLTMLPTLEAILLEDVRGANRYGYTVSMTALACYADYLGTVQELGDTVHFRPNFDPSNPSGILEMHDAAVAVFNLKRDEIQAKEFDALLKTWDKWLYEDDDYAIIAPKSPNDIAQEGIALSHCVRTYISKVLARTTNILFLRKKEDLSKPFFTIEVTNDGAVQQIHGFGNRNLSTEPDAEPFVKAWIKARKMKATNFNKIR